MSALAQVPYDPEYDRPAESPISATERQPVGMALARPRILDELRIKPSDFYRTDMEAAWSIMQSMAAKGRSITPITVVEESKAAGGTIISFATLLQAFHDSGGEWPLAPQYADLVIAAARRRRVAAIGQRLVQVAHDAPDPDSLLEQAAAAFARALDEGGPLELTTLPEAAREFLESLETMVEQARTPWRELDKWIGGWRPGRMYVIGARPGSGKSIVGLQAAQHMAAVTGRDVALSSLEMDAGEVSQRALCAATSVDFFALQNRHVSAEQKVALWRAHEEMEDARGTVHVDDRASVRPGDVAAHARKVARSGRLGMVVVDYLQLMEAAGSGRSDSRQQDVSVMTRAMKNLARDLHVPVLVLSQLNRAVESRGDGPRLSDLRESGSLEQDADVVLLLHHEARTEANAAEPDTLEMRVAKNRQGPQGMAHLAWEGRYMRVSD